jgi:hypothetical protein
VKHAIDTGPARKKATRRKPIPNRGAKTEKVDESTVTASSTFGNNSDPARQLIRCQDDVLLYQLSQGGASSYEVVSPTGESWSFSLRYQAESKFERVASRMPNGGKEEGREQH